MTISRKEILKCYSQQAAAAKHQWRKHFEQLNKLMNGGGAGRSVGQTRCKSPQCSSDSFPAFYIFHISTARCRWRVRVANQVTSKKEPKRRREKEAQRGKWQMACFVLPFDSPRLDFFLPVCVSRAKRKPFCKSCLFELPFHCLAYPVIELISCISAAKTYAESLVHK